LIQELIVIVCSFLFGVIAQSLNLPFLTEEHFQSGLSDQIPIDGSYIDIPLIEGISHPFSFQIIVEWYFHSPSGSEFSVSRFDNNFKSRSSDRNNSRYNK
jgi:hypothetical protein